MKIEHSQIAITSIPFFSKVEIVNGDRVPTRVMLHHGHDILDWNVDQLIALRDALTDVINVAQNVSPSAIARSLDAMTGTRRPRVFVVGDPEPTDVFAVLDRYGDRWTSEDWKKEGLAGQGWSLTLSGHGPLIEVFDRGAK